MTFSGGELAPSLRARADLAKYANGLALCENFLIRPQGGAYNRAGLRYIATVGDSSKKARLIPFQFSSEESFLLLFEENTIRFIKDDQYIEVLSAPYEVVSTYTEDELYRIQYTQDADVMTLVHPNHPPRELRRIADDNWQLVDVDFTSNVLPPDYVVVSSASITDISNDQSAVVTTSAAHGFESGQIINISGVAGAVGTVVNGNGYPIAVQSATTFVLTGADTSSVWAYTSGGTAELNAITVVGSGGGTFVKEYTYVISAVNDEGVESLPGPEITATTASLSSTYGLNLQWVDNGAAYYRIYKDVNDGTGNYGWIGDSNTTQFTDFNIAPLTSDAPLSARNPFNSAGNYPQTVGYYQQRLVYANTLNDSQTVYTTRTNEFNSLRTSVPARADDAVTFTIKGRQVNEIRHIISIDSLILLTSGGEWLVSEGRDEVLTPQTVGVRTQSYNGASWVQPAVMPNSFMYVQNRGNKIRNINYSRVNLSYNDNDVSLISEHLFDGFDIVELSYQAEPYGIMWAVRDDGRLLGLTYEADQQVSAWHQHVTEGEFESIAVLDTDTLYTIVKRSINGNQVRYVEKLEKRYQDAPENAIYLDASFVYEGVSTTTITGLDHLVNTEVVAVADGNVVRDVTVSVTGELEIPRAAEKVIIGLPYIPALETLDIDSAENIKGKRVNVSNVTLVLEKSRGGWVGPVLDPDDINTQDSVMQEIKPRQDSDGYGTIQLKTKQFEVEIPKQWRKGGGVRIEQRTPMPFGLLAVIPKIDVSS